MSKQIQAPGGQIYQGSDGRGFMQAYFGSLGSRSCEHKKADRYCEQGHTGYTTAFS